MGWIIFSLVAGYPSGDCLPENFIAHLTPGAPDFGGALFAVLLAVIFGLLVYILPLVLLKTEHAQPYPLWLHCFYWAADFMGIWIFLYAWATNDFFYLFGLLAFGEAIWVVMETFCLQRAIKYERELCWPADWSTKKCVVNIVLMTLAFFVALNLLRVELYDPTMWKFWIFTQVLVTIVPGLEMERRGYRLGNARWLNVCFICVAIVSFNPWCNMWAAIAPEFFGLAENPWYYIVGIVCLAFAIRGFVLYEKLPAKPGVIEATGKKPLLK